MNYCAVYIFLLFIVSAFLRINVIYYFHCCIQTVRRCFCDVTVNIPAST